MSIEWAQLIVDTVRATAWPIAIVLVVFLFRAPIKDKLNDLLRASGMGAVLEFVDPSVAVPAGPQPAISDAAARVAELFDETGNVDKGSHPDRDSNEDALEDLIRDAIALGFESASDYSEVPETEITWNDENRPQLSLKDTTPRRDRHRAELYADRSGKFRFRVKAPNGQVLAVGEAYETKEAALRAVRYLLSGTYGLDDQT